MRENNGSATAEPAPSIHVWWKGDLEPNELTDGWVIRNTVQVAQSHKATYFCTIGTDDFYGGIQERENYTKIGIFSVWDTVEGSAVEMKKHRKCQVSSFGGEGKGLRCTREIEWAIGDKITQKIVGEKMTNGNEVGVEQVWKLSSAIKVAKPGGNSKWYELATVKWTGNRSPLPNPSFYSFIEDWDRSIGADGYKYPRKAQFTNPQIKPIHPSIKLKQHFFTQAESHLDKEGAKKTIIRQELITDTKVLMCTGGDNLHDCVT